MMDARVKPGHDTERPMHTTKDNVTIRSLLKPAATSCELVIAGLDSAIHRLERLLRRMMDARVKPGHDTERPMHTTKDNVTIRGLLRPAATSCDLSLPGLTRQSIA